MVHRGTGVLHPAVSGRVLAIAIDPTSPIGNRTMYIGAATGGVWKSTDNGTTWSPTTDDRGSLAIGAIAIDPNKSSRIFAGTGEYHTADEGASVYYGNGLLLSEQGGQPGSWKELAASQFERDEITRVLFDPTNDATSQRMFLSSATGVYESTNGGAFWQLLRAGSASDLVAIFNPGSPPTVQLIAAFYGEGLYTSTRTGSTWSAWAQIGSNAYPASFGRIALGQCRDVPQTIWAAFSAGAGGTIAGLAKTDTGGASWVSVPWTPQLPYPSLAYNYQTWYNLLIAVHPKDPDIVYLGEVQLWKKPKGSGSWAHISADDPATPPPYHAIHVDQHALTFDPDNPETIWVGNDGGVYRSDSGGAKWLHRNRELATLQYYHISTHPQWEAVMLGGTMDNDLQRYEGNPAWQFSYRNGDVGFTAIDPNTPTRMYAGTTRYEIWRSDKAGGNNSWVPKNAGITGASSEVEWNPPFTLDPSDPNVCYFGSNRVWRSANNADTWEPITGPLIGNSTAIAVHPLDPATLYVGTSNGRVYRLKKGATWKLADVTPEDLTATEQTGLPPGVYISDLAVDTTGTLWVTLSSVLYSEATGEFSNDHVYRRDGMTGKWEARVNGLAKANPINTIVIDPAKNMRLFCGGDIGVFRTDDAGLKWQPWDQGLPHAPVLHLAIHEPRRLLRAATYGRSVWERPIDTAFCQMVDLYLRDNILDTGRVQPTPSGHPHPFDPSTLVHYWQSVDIKVDVPDPDFQTPLPLTDYVFFESELEHRQFKPGAKNRFYIQVHNRGPEKATNVLVRAFFANGSAGLPPLPPDFWSGVKPFGGNQFGLDWTPIGDTRVIPQLEPGEPGVVVWEYDVPSSTPKHCCLLALATCNEDPLVAALLNADELVKQHKHVTLKNLHLDKPRPGSPLRADQAYILELHNPEQDEAPLDLVFRWESLPAKARLFVAFEKLRDGRPAVLASLDDLKRERIALARPQETLFQEKVEHGCGGIRHFDLRRIYQLSMPRERTTTIPLVRRPASGPLLVAINLLVPENVKEESASFSVVQQVGRRLVGGSTYLLQLKR